MVNIDKIKRLLQKYSELWEVISNGDSIDYVYPEAFCLLDSSHDGYDYSEGQMLYMLFNIEGHHEFIALYVPEEYADRADECPVLFVDPEDLDDDNNIVGSVSVMSNIKYYLNSILHEYISSDDNDPKYVKQCHKIIKKIEKLSNNLLHLPYHLKPDDV